MAELYPFQKQILNGIRSGEIKVTVTGAGRQVGKSYVNSLIQNWYAGMKEHKPTIKWQRLPGLKLRAYIDDVQARGFERGLNDLDMEPIQAWTDECNCGTRMSFNVWKFKSEKHITMFLMKWSN